MVVVDQQFEGLHMVYTQVYEEELNRDAKSGMQLEYEDRTREVVRPRKAGGNCFEGRAEQMSMKKGWGRLFDSFQASTRQ